MGSDEVTKVYFIRHAPSDVSVRDEMLRPLTPRGAEDARRVARVLASRPIAGIYSSPYRRSISTVKPLAGALGLPVEIREDLGERRVGAWVDDFREYYRRQWSDFDYRLDGGESLREAQARNVARVRTLVEEDAGLSMAVGTHGTALSLILNHYDPTFDVRGFEAIVDRMPWVVLCRFEGTRMMDWSEVDIG